jgi:competence protein ComEC
MVFPRFPAFVRSPIVHGAVILLAALALGLMPGLKDSYVPAFAAANVVSLKGRLLDDPRISVSRIRGGGERGIARLEVSEEGAADLPGVSGQARGSSAGRVLVFFPEESIPRIKEFGRGAEVYIEGRFIPDRDGGFAERRFSSKGVHVFKPAPALERFRTSVRTLVLERFKGRDANSWGGLAAALLLGTRENLDSEMADRFRDAGVSHVLALSGMHLAFFSGILALLLKPLLGKKGAALAGLAFILAYVFLVGPQPSLVRAAIMYVLGALSMLAGIPRQSLVVLALAFCIQTLWDPSSALGPSFILSYSALAGLLLLSGPFSLFLEGRLPKPLAQSLSLSLGAFTAASPAVIAFFGILRPVGILTGLVVVPPVSLFMALSVLYLALGTIFPFSVILDKLLSVILGLMGYVVRAASHVPGIKAPFPVVFALCVLCAVMLPLISGRYRKYRCYLAPFA